MMCRPQAGGRCPVGVRMMGLVALLLPVAAVAMVAGWKWIAGSALA